MLRFSWNFLSAPQADVKSALVCSFRVLRGTVNFVTRLNARPASFFHFSHIKKQICN
ncbi:hypothetical protein NTGHW29_20063 [Candidatus Nitrotoga sp. HW29]|nr:hypothetical protein NTGHW29_20063 [Candidatus Nitrotoga sp. HW29]